MAEESEYLAIPGTASHQGGHSQFRNQIPLVHDTLLTQLLITRVRVGHGAGVGLAEGDECFVHFGHGESPVICKGLMVAILGATAGMTNRQKGPFVRSEERRVGKECRSRWGREQ